MNASFILFFVETIYKYTFLFLKDYFSKCFLQNLRPRQ